MTTARPLKFWRSLGELAHSEDFQRFHEAEFPEEANVTLINRRDLLRLMGATAASASLTACTRAPAETIVPYVRAPEEFVPGRPLYFATAMSFGGFAKGLLVESHLGRPTKVEGNPDHPASLGATDPFGQGSVLDLYDPDRSQVVTHLGHISTWSAFTSALADAVGEQRLKKGAGLRILTERTTSPTLVDQINALLQQFPSAKWHQYEPISRDNVREGALMAFGQIVQTRYHFDRADLIVSLDADFLGCGPSNLCDARHFSKRRQPGDGQTMNRLYVLESTPSITGSMADHRLRLPAHRVQAAAVNIARRATTQAAVSSPQSGTQSDQTAVFIEAVARDLGQHRGSSLVIAGDSQPPAVHALAHAMNSALGNEGRAVEYTDPVEARPDGDMSSLADLVESMKQGAVELLVILGGNPAFTAPRDIDFANQLSRVAFRVHLSLYEDESSALCQWHVPQAHFLEAWGDTRAFDGTTSIVQPLIAPLYSGKSEYELLAAVAGDPDRSGYDIVRDYWQRQMPGATFEERWQQSLNDGLIAGSALQTKPVKLQTTIDALASRAPAAPPAALEIVFRPDPTVWDGRFANNQWLQEMPKPLTRLTWDSAALFSPATASRLGLATGDVVELRTDGPSVQAPVFVLPGQADDSVAIALGYGRSRGGRSASGVGFNAYAIRSSRQPWFDGALSVRKTGKQYELASTQHHFSMEGRDFIRVGTLDEFTKDPRFAREAGEAPDLDDTLYPAYRYEGHAWGMTVDLNACIGCGACVVACQAENNVPVVGKSEVLRGREMHWIRVDGYFEGDPNDPRFYHEPVLCMHCENAPCELVCPVGATVHSDEGLNQMVYNRCVGTRYCSNNCPYKVRRFNFFQYADWTTPSLKGQRNPNVTVRSRGVMEKCTYCVQRINAAKIDAEKADRPLRDGEIVTACQAVCPSQAIVFGDINDPNSRVAALRSDPRSYGLLTELNTRPHTTYLARLRNPNPELDGVTTDGR